MTTTANIIPNYILIYYGDNYKVGTIIAYTFTIKLPYSYPYIRAYYYS